MLLLHHIDGKFSEKKQKMKKYRRLSRNEREELAVFLNRGHSLRKIAFYLGRSHSSLVREIHRNYGPLKYRPVDAHMASSRRQQSAHKRPKQLRLNAQLRSRVTRELKLGWSPEIISGRLRLESKSILLSHEAIYRWIYSDAKKLIPFLVRSHPRRQQRWRQPWPKRIISQRVSIKNRPEEVNLRQVLGHWETDLICGTGTSALQVLVERKTRFVQLRKLQNKTPQHSYETLFSIFTRIRPELRKSITYDNGIENQLHYHLNDVFHMKSYFCEPYHSWEKGTVENTNGIIRRFLKKGTNLSTIPQIRIQKIQDWLNQRPRKCLNYLTPAEAFHGTGAIAR